MAEQATDVIGYDELNDKLNIYEHISDFTKKELDDLLELSRQYVDADSNLTAWVERGPGDSDDPQKSESEKKVKRNLASRLSGKKERIKRWIHGLLESYEDERVTHFISEKLEENPTDVEVMTVVCGEAVKQLQSDEDKTRLADEAKRALENCLTLTPNL